jgi:SNF2 family DNA or RNA helicase
MGDVLVEIKGKRIKVEWPRQVGRDTFADYVRRVKTVQGRRFVKGTAHQSGHWTTPLDLDSCRALRDAFGELLVIGPELRQWAQRETSMERNLHTLASTDTAELVHLPTLLPKLYERLHVGPRGRFMTDEEFQHALTNDEPSYQCADVAFMCESDAPLNANEMGLGKTYEIIGAVYESLLHDGPKLVIAPKSVLASVWQAEVEDLTDERVLVCTGTRADRAPVMAQAAKLAAAGEAFWLVINPGMVTFSQLDTLEFYDEELYAEDDPHKPTWFESPEGSVHVQKATAAQQRSRHVCKCKDSRNAHLHYGYSYPELFGIEWNVLVLDEAHRAAIGNTKALTYQALSRLKAKKKIMATGTPMGGRPLKLYAILSWLRPDVYRSKWGWAEKYLVIDPGDGYGQKIMDEVREDAKEAFYRSLVPYVLRRTKAEVLTYLPPKQIIDVWVELDGKQKEQYDTFAADADVEIGDRMIMGKGVLDMYTRLRQFAIARQTVRGDKLTPTTDSCKLPALQQIMNELGMFDGSDEQIVIFSQYTEVVDMVTDWLNNELHVKAHKITGKVKDSERTALQADFQSGGFQAMVMNVKAGGVGINLDRASTVVFLDETWNPDDQDQAMDRCHRASRIHQVTCYFIRTKDTIEDLVFDRVTGKQMTSQEVMDGRRGVLAPA